MTQAWFLGAKYAVDQRESEVRSTLAPLRDDGPAESQEPDWNEFESDGSGELTGLSTRMLAPDTHESEQYKPEWIEGASTPHNILIDAQVASSGTAAAREAAGIQGHGTMQYGEAIDPVIREAGAFGNDYFAANLADIQDGAGDYMTPAPDQWSNAVAAARASADSRAAYSSSQYAELLGR